MTWDKASLRREFLARVRSMTAEAKALESAAIRERILNWPPFAAAQSVLVFCPLPSEPDLLPLMGHESAADKQFLFPVTHPDHTLTLHSVSRPEDLRVVSGFLREPDPEIHPEVDKAAVEAALIPGVAFTVSGSRLGRGRGCYDRLLATLGKQVPVAGICFRCQIADNLPREGHDITVPPLREW